MEQPTIYGYAGKLLRVDLSKKEVSIDDIDEAVLKNYVGGAALGIKYVYDNVPPEIEWSDPKNCLFLGAGPLSGTKIGGSGGIAAITKGALTNGMTSS